MEALELETWRAPSGEEIPNHPSFPVLLYRGPQGRAFDVFAGDVVVLPRANPDGVWTCCGGPRAAPMLRARRA